MAHYLHLDSLAEGIVGYIGYKFACWRCFWTPPSIGHEWDDESNSLEAHCAHCPKHWFGNL